MVYYKRQSSFSPKKGNYYGRRSTSSSHTISGSCFLTQVMASGSEKPLFTQPSATYPQDTVTAYLGTSARGYNCQGIETNMLPYVNMLFPPGIRYFVLNMRPDGPDYTIPVGSNSINFPNRNNVNVFSNYASLYDRYCFRSLTFEYIPSVSRDSGGQVIMVWNSNPSDQLPARFEELSVYPDHKVGPVGSRLRLTVRPNQWRYTYAAPQQNGYVADRQSDSGWFCVSGRSMTPGEDCIGTIVLHYEVVLAQPSINPRYNNIMTQPINPNPQPNPTPVSGKGGLGADINVEDPPESKLERKTGRFHEEKKPSVSRKGAIIMVERNVDTVMIRTRLKGNGGIQPDWIDYSQDFALTNQHTGRPLMGVLIDGKRYEGNNGTIEECTQGVTFSGFVKCRKYGCEGTPDFFNRYYTNPSGGMWGIPCIVFKTRYTMSGQQLRGQARIFGLIAMIVSAIISIVKVVRSVVVGIKAVVARKKDSKIVSFFASAEDMHAPPYHYLLSSRFADVTPFNKKGSTEMTVDNTNSGPVELHSGELTHEDNMPDGPVAPTFQVYAKETSPDNRVSSEVEIRPKSFKYAVVDKTTYNTLGCPPLEVLLNRFSEALIYW